MVTEEDIAQIKKEIITGHNKNPEEMFCAFCFVFADAVAIDFAKFMEGLEEDFTKKEKLMLLKGIMERKAHFWENSDLEELYEMSSKILREFYAIRKKSNGRPMLKSKG